MSAWTDLERDKHPPTMKTQRGVATAMQWPIDWWEQLQAGITPAVVDGLSTLDLMISANPGLVVVDGLRAFAINRAPATVDEARDAFEEYCQQHPEYRASLITTRLELLEDQVRLQGDQLNQLSALVRRLTAEQMDDDVLLGGDATQAGQASD